MELRLLVWLGVESSAVALGLALLFTYVVHSVIWVATAALLARVRAISSATRHLLWKMALFGPILSALFAVAVSSALARSPMTSSYVHELKIPALAAPLASPPVDTPAATNARAAAVVRVLTPRVRGSDRRGPPPPPLHVPAAAPRHDPRGRDHRDGEGPRPRRTQP